MKIAAYCRVSTDKEDQANSLESQVRYFREYINCGSGWELYEIYADEGITGTSTKKREAFNRMLTDARAGKFERILTKEVSRFARNTVDTLQYTRELKCLGIGVIFLNDGINTLEADAELRLSIMGSIAQEESRKTSSRVKWGQTRRMEQGVVFGRSLLGYDVKRGEMTINPEGARLVQLIFHKYVYEQKGVATIARELSEAGYRTMSGGMVWQRSVILKILRNEKYCGDLCQKKTITPDYLTHQKKYNRGEEKMVFLRNHHEPIISRELWERAQMEISRRRTERNTSMMPEFSRRYPLSGKIICTECGKSFVSRQRNVDTKSVLSKKSYRIWRCGTTVQFGKCHIDAAGHPIGCDVSYQLRDDVVVKMVQQSLAQLFKELQIDKGEIVSELAKLVEEAKSNEQQNEKKDSKRWKQELIQLQEKKIRALDAFLSLVVSEEDFLIMNGEYDKKISEIKRYIERQEQMVIAENDEMLREEIVEKIWRIIGDRRIEIEEQRDVKKRHAEKQEKIEGKEYEEKDERAIYGNLVESIVAFSDKRLRLTIKGLPYTWIYILR